MEAVHGNSCTNFNIRMLYNYTFLNVPFMMTFINIQETLVF